MIKKLESRKSNLTQSGSINKVLTTSKMEDSNLVLISPFTILLGIDTGINKFN